MLCVLVLMKDINKSMLSPRTPTITLEHFDASSLSTLEKKRKKEKMFIQIKNI